MFFILGAGFEIHFKQVSVCVNLYTIAVRRISMTLPVPVSVVRDSPMVSALISV
jgi:hypothetical protein